MQNSQQTYFKDRALFYSGFPVRDGAIKGDWDYKLPYVYVLSLLNFEIEDADCRKEQNIKENVVQITSKNKDVAGATANNMSDVMSSLFRN